MSEVAEDLEEEISKFDLLFCLVLVTTVIASGICWITCFQRMILINILMILLALIYVTERKASQAKLEKQGRI